MVDSADATLNSPDCGNPFVSVPIEIMVVVGKARPLIKELVGLGENAVLTLDKRVDDPVELYVGTKLIARGELQELDGDPTGQLVVRLTEVINLKNGF